MESKRIRLISTTTGDAGTSKNYSNESLSKADVTFEVLGTIDELSSSIGLTYHYSKNETLKEIQRRLQTIMTMVAVNPATDKERFERIAKVNETDVAWLESIGEALLSIKPLSPHFVLPGSETTLAGAYYDMARTICRRAERVFVRYVELTGRTDLRNPQIFLNRLSDTLYILARSEN